MNIQKYLSNLFIISLFFISSTPTYATAISNANATFLWDSFTLNGHLVNHQDFFVDAETSLFNDTLDERNRQGDAFDTYLEQSDVNVSVVSGYDDFDDFYAASTFSESITSDSRSASSEALTSIYIPFEADVSEAANVSFLYDLFASADAPFLGEFSLAIASLSVSLLDDSFDEIEFALSDELLATAEGTVDFPDAILSNFDYTFSGLTEGDTYFVAIDAYAFSATEANNVNTVPEPRTLMLLMMGLTFIGGIRLHNPRFTSASHII